MKINFYNSQSLLPIKVPYWRKIIKEAAMFEEESFAEVTVHFVEKDEIAYLHKIYFEDPSVTDCISFPIDGPEEPYRVLGEIFVSPEVAIEVAALRRENPLKETALYVIHALLHLFGYNDMKKIDRQKMKRREKEHIQHLEAKGFF